MKNNLYAVSLSAAMALSGCGKKKLQLEEGVYKGIVGGELAFYRVERIGTDYSCDLVMLKENSPGAVLIHDTGCNNAADRYYDSHNPSGREIYDAERQHFDSLLREGRKLVKPENKLK